MLNSYGQNKPDIIFKGRILNISDNSPIAGAAIVFIELDKSTVTDEQGDFKLRINNTGNFKVLVSHLAFLPLEREVNVKSGNNEVLFLLKEAVKEMQEIVISGGFFNTHEETPYKIESISGKNLQKMGSHNLMNALSTVPGINMISYGPGIGKPVIRGLSFSRIMTIYQGIRFENQQWGEEHGLGLNDLGIDRVEILKGPASVLYGSGALGGVINIIDEKPLTDGLKGEFLLQGFSNTLGARANLGIKGGNKHGYFFSVRGNSESHADYTGGNYRQIGNSRFNNSMIKGKGGVQKNWGSSMFTYTYNRQLLAIIEEDEMDNSLATSRADRTLLIPYQEVTDHLVTLQNEFHLQNNSRIIFNLSHHLNLREENEESFDQVDLGLILNTSTYDFKYNFLPTPNSEMIIGFQGFRQSNINMKEAHETLLPDSELFDNSIFGLFAQDKNRLKIQGGLRFDYRNIKANSRKLDDFILPGAPENQELTRRFSGFTGSIGSTYKFWDHFILKVNLASGFRAPDLAELFSNGEHPGTNRFEKGNVDFDREQNIETDLSLHYKNKNFSFEAATYYNLINNYIFFNPTNQYENNLRIWQFEQDNVYLFGGETGISVHPETLKGFSSKHTFSLVRGHITRNNEYLPLMPADRFFHELRYENNKKLFFNSQYIYLNLQNVLGQDRLGGNELPTSGYNLISIGGGAKSTYNKYELEFDLIISNILNTLYFDHMALTRQFDIPNMGRNATVGIKVIF
ncbi:MAG: TonB-dependent receptor [Bacteroidota bacterium]|nr:TonB-dependent receptor [Bacteroidota bacterium]